MTNSDDLVALLNIEKRRRSILTDYSNKNVGENGLVRRVQHFTSLRADTFTLNFAIVRDPDAIIDTQKSTKQGEFQVSD